MGSLDRMRLIGRDDESAELYDAMMLASQGQPQLVLVLGDAGIGKTGLVNDLLTRADELGFATATGHCLDIEAAMSFAPAVEAVRVLLTGDDGVGTRPQARRMRAAAPSVSGYLSISPIRTNCAALASLPAEGSPASQRPQNTVMR